MTRQLTSGRDSLAFCAGTGIRSIELGIHILHEPFRETNDGVTDIAMSKVPANSKPTRSCWNCPDSRGICG